MLRYRDHPSREYLNRADRQRPLNAEQLDRKVRMICRPDLAHQSMPTMLRLIRGVSKSAPRSLRSYRSINLTSVFFVAHEPFVMIICVYLRV